MNEPGVAQLELIRRYSRTLRELHADAMRVQGPRIGARAARRTSSSAEPLIQAAKSLASDATTAGTPETRRMS
jgi:hypothetical protein